MTTQEIRLPGHAMPLERLEPSAADVLVDGLRRGDVVSVGQAYDAHHEAVRAFCRRLVGDPTFAEDLVHDVFVALPKAIRRFRGDASLRTFLMSIAVNHARHHVRSAVRRRAYLERLSKEPAGQSTTPEETMRRRQLAEALSRALDRLPLDQRVAFVLCEVEGHTSTEAAVIVGRSENTVRTRLFHAKKKLRVWLEQEVER